MNQRLRRQKPVSEINITPFTDVILVLLIIFMVTTPLIWQASLKVKLPAAKNAKTSANERQAGVCVTITDEGLIYLNEKYVTKEELKKNIRAMCTNNPELNVTLSSDRSVSFKDIVGLLDIFTELGIKNLTIAATTEH